MKLRKINLIILLTAIDLVAFSSCSDHVQVLRCSEDQDCMDHLDQQLLEIIHANMVNTTQPCEHFWDYACGSWTSAPYYDHVDNFGAMSNYYAENLIKVLKKLHKKKSKESGGIKDLVKQIMKYFQSCKTMEAYYLQMSPYLGVLPVQKIFGQSFKWSGIFLEQETSMWQDFDWLSSVAYLRKYGFSNILLQESVNLAWNDSLQYVVDLKIPHARKSFENKYKILQIMEEFDLIFAHNKNQSKNYLNLVDEIYKFDKSLVNLLKKYDSNKKDHYLTLQDLSDMAGSLNWFKYFEILMDQKPSSEILIEFSGDLEYFQDLTQLLLQTPKNITGSYILIRFCQYLMDIRPLITEKECLLHTNVMFPLGINFIYDSFIYQNRLEDETLLQTIFSQLKYEFSRNIKENKFALDLKEQKYLQEKLDLMKLKIGNLPLEVPNINDYYSSVNLTKNNFYHNHLEMLEFRTWKQHEVLLNPDNGLVNLNTYYINDDISQLRNAPYFVHQRNTLLMPMLFLQLPFYHYNQHPALQYSLVGWIMAHELSHAFDTHGLKYDAWGNENLLGLQLSHKESYRSSLECLTKLTPTVSLNERMADVNGLQLAWQTFSRRVSLDMKYYGDFPLTQLFFINFAQFFCGSLPQPIGHDRDDVRVRQSVSNMREFSEIFQCCAEAKENPREKCNIWRKQ